MWFAPLLQHSWWNETSNYIHIVWIDAPYTMLYIVCCTDMRPSILMWFFSHQLDVRPVSNMNIVLCGFDTRGWQNTLRALMRTNRSCSSSLRPTTLLLFFHTHLPEAFAAYTHPHLIPRMSKDVRTIILVVTVLIPVAAVIVIGISGNTYR